MTHTKKYYLFTGSSLLILFLLLAGAIHQNLTLISTIDQQTQQRLTTQVQPFYTTLLTSLTFFASPVADIILTSLIALILWLQRHRFLSVWIIFVQLGGDTLAFLMKEVIRRPRPTQQLSLETGFSFPSGHTFCTALLIFTVLWLVIPRMTDQEKQLVAVLIALIWLVLIAYSRIYLRDHFLTDILGSFLLAGSWWEFMQVAYHDLQQHTPPIISNLFKGDLQND